MQFKDLAINMRFRFHSYSNEIWRKLNDTECICLSYGDSEVDEPYSVTQKVFPIVEREQVDKFQPLALVRKLEQYKKDVRENERLEPVQKEYIALGLTWAIAEIMAQATAKDRYTPEDTGYPGIDKATEQHLMEHNG